MRVLVTGASGFLGSQLVELSIEKHDLVAVVRRRPSAALTRLERQDDLCVECVELTDRASVRTLLRHWRPDAVLHCAARIPSHAKEDAFVFFDDNVRATLNLLIEAHDADVRRFVYSSSMSIYGPPLYLPVNEEHPVVPTTAYGVSKLEGEFYGRVCANSSPMSVTVLRYSGMYGKGQRSGAVRSFIARCLAAEPLVLHAGGRPSSDYVWVEDAGRASLLALDWKTPKMFDVFNIGSGAELTTRALAEMIRRLAGSSSLITVSDDLSTRDFRFVYSIEKAKAELSYRPTDPEVALRRCIDQWKAGVWQ